MEHEQTTEGQRSLLRTPTGMQVAATYRITDFLCQKSIDYLDERKYDTSRCETQFIENANISQSIIENMHKIF